MSIYKPNLLDKFKDFVNGLKSNWDQYEDHVADFESHLAESANKHIHSHGNNSNGYWVRFDDGTQICQGRVNVDISVWNFNAGTGDLPISFADNNYSVSLARYSPTVSNQPEMIALSSIVTSASANNQFKCGVGNPVSTSKIFVFNYTAIGRWK